MASVDIFHRMPWAVARRIVGYENLRNSFTAKTLDNPGSMRYFEEKIRLPDGFGYAFDERVIEYPWLFAQCPNGKILDAGSVLNHEFILDRFLPIADDLHIAALAPEDRAFFERGVSYDYADIRDMPFRDELFKTIDAAVE